jgi:hypothetical protein
MTLIEGPRPLTLFGINVILPFNPTLISPITFPSTVRFTTDATSSLYHAPSHTRTLSLLAILLFSPPFSVQYKMMSDI